MSKNTKRRKLIIFDLDGTLYALRGGSYARSPLRRRVLRNAERFIAKRLATNKKDSRQVLLDIQEKYGEQISIGLEKEYGLDRYDYFNTVWDISARGIVRKPPQLSEILGTLRREHRLALVSDAPRVWIDHVLKELGIQSFFRGRIFPGEGNRRKGFDNAFQEVAKMLKTNPRDCIAVGDQEKTDIIPARKLGMLTVFVHPTKRCFGADANIRTIRELPARLQYFASFSSM